MAVLRRLCYRLSRRRHRAADQLHPGRSPGLFNPHRDLGEVGWVEEAAARLDVRLVNERRHDDAEDGALGGDACLNAGASRMRETSMIDRPVTPNSVSSIGPTST